MVSCINIIIIIIHYINRLSVFNSLPVLSEVDTVESCPTAKNKLQQQKIILIDTILDVIDPEL